MYNKGFVFGKFLPFHKGHEAMFRFARQYCDKLTVLICCSESEDISCSTRLNWIRETIADDLDIEVQVYSYNERDLPNTSVTSNVVSQIWADVFQSLLPQHDLLITSEPYGSMVASFMGINHIPFDLHRRIVPVSASVIRDDLFANWRYLPDAVRSYYAKKVVLLGTESTGKSTLTKIIAEHFGATFVAEAGREIIANSNNFSIEDLYKVATVHAATIELAVRADSPLVIIDTDVHITQSYAQYFFNTPLLLPAKVYEANQADLYLYLTNDAPYVQDGTRLGEDSRNRVDASHKKVLADAGISYVPIGGNWEERRRAAITAINTWLNRQN